MDKETKLKHLYNYFNDCWRLTLTYDYWEIASRLCLSSEILNGWQPQDWVDAYNRLDFIIQRSNRFMKENPEYSDGCVLLNRKVNMLREGIKITLEKEFALKPFCRNKYNQTIEFAKY